MVPELRNLQYDERLDCLNLWSLEERRVHADLIEVYKIVHGHSPIAFDDFFEFDKSGQVTAKGTGPHRVTGPELTPLLSVWLLPLTGTVGGDVSANNRASINNDTKPVIRVSTTHRATCEPIHTSVNDVNTRHK